MRTVVFLLAGVLVLLVAGITAFVVMLDPPGAEPAGDAGVQLIEPEAAAGRPARPGDPDVPFNEIESAPATIDTAFPGGGRGVYRPNPYADQVARRGTHEETNADGPRLEAGAEFDVTKQFIYAEVNSTHLLIDDADLHGGAPLGEIPSLYRPAREPAADASDLWADAPVVVVRIGEHVVAYPIAILTWHEAVNDLVGDVPVLVTYNALCDAVAVFDPRITVTAAGETGGTIEKSLNFDISGLVANSNTVFCDKTYQGLWSQGLMQCISGPLAGTRLRTRLFAVMSFAAFRDRFPAGEVVSFSTGEQRDYRINPYEPLARQPDTLMYPVRNVGTALPLKMPGASVVDRGSERATFIPLPFIRAQGDGRYEYTTASGPVVLRASESGLAILDKPDDVDVMQIQYFAWSAFYPDGEVLSE